jgi:predicted DNA-binding transcriptional regulator AlpA
MGTALNAPPEPMAADMETAGPDGVIPRFFDRKTLAAFLLVSTRTLDRLDSNGKLPPSVRIGAAKRWTRVSIEEWLRLGCPGRDGTATPSVGRK